MIFKKKDEQEQIIEKLEQDSKSSINTSDKLSGWANPNKDWAFYFHSPYQIEVFKRTVQDGKLRFRDREWDVSQSRAFSVKTGHGKTDAWFVTDKSVYPMSPSDFKVHLTDITPEMVKRLPEQKIMNFLMKRFKSPGEGASIGIGAIVIGAVMGFLVLWMLLAFNLMPDSVLQFLGIK